MITLQKDSLQTHFGFTSFRPGQAEAIQSLVDGRHTLVVMPTGAGKSLIYQLTALQLPGVTLVISPLIALMKDQVDSLVRRGIPAAFINSTLPASEQNQRLKSLVQGSYRLFYVAPERLRSAPFHEAIRAHKVSLLAVDEVHCISEWGHDFRPDYLQIAAARAALGNPLTVALTATATPQVQNDIERLLGIPDARRIVTGFNRPNLRFEVRYTTSLPAKLQVLRELGSDQKSGASLIYAGTRRDAEEVAEFVRQVIGVQAEHYHAGLETVERARIQDDFLTGKLPVVVATNAFGMGIDRQDVRQVLHYTLPGTLEAYYQEAGRAGRDGLPARAVLLYAPQDRALQEWFIENSATGQDELRTLYEALLPASGHSIWITTEDLSRQTALPEVKVRVGLAQLERSGAIERLGDEGLRMLLRRSAWNHQDIQAAIDKGRDHQRNRKAQLDKMVAYAETNICRRRILLNHFGDQSPAEALECCDNCHTQPVSGAGGGDITQLSKTERIALVILDSLRRLKWNVGREKLAQTLKGSRAKDIQKFGYDKSPYYGRLEALSKSRIEGLIEQLIQQGYLKVIGGQYPVLSLTPHGEAAIREKAAIPLELAGHVSFESVAHKKAEREPGGTVEYTAQMFSEEGLSPAQIAEARGLSLSTIYSHLARLIAAGRVELDAIVPAHIQQQVESAFEQVGGTGSLTAIKSVLAEDIDYNLIRCVVEAYKRRTGQLEGDGLDNPKEPEAVPRQISALESPESTTRRLAASALGEARDARALEPLMRLLILERDPRVRLEAVKALGDLCDPRAKALLQKISADEREQEYTRQAAVVSISRLANTPQNQKDAQDAIEARQENPFDDSVENFLSKPHPRPLKGPWNAGWALDFHSRFMGAEWSRSTVGELAYRLKYLGDPSALDPLVDQAILLIGQHPELTCVDAIVTVPPSNPRQLNPVIAFAEGLGKRLGLEVADVLVKTRQTSPQKELHTLAQKRANVAGAFAIQGAIHGKRLLLVDDLFDSGATLEEITCLLLASGAAMIHVLTLTRTIHSDA